MTEFLSRNHCTDDRQMAYGISLLSHIKLTPQMRSYSCQSSGVYENRMLLRAVLNQLSSGFNSEKDFLFLTPKAIHDVGHNIFSIICKKYFPYIRTGTLDQTIQLRDSDQQQMPEERHKNRTSMK